jgi:3-methyladenine DNA glycosylase Tag
MVTEEEKEEKKLEELLEEKRHKEVLSAINKLATVISSNRSIEVVSAIEKNTQSLNQFVLALKEIRQEVNVETNQGEVISALHKLADDINKSLEKQNSILIDLARSKEGTFTLNKNSNGYIESVTYKQK